MSTEKIFTSSIDEADDLQTATSIKERTLKIKFGSGTSGMYFLNSTLVGDALLEVVPAAEIIALGCLRGNHEWHVTLASTAAKDALLEAGAVSTCSLGSTRSGYTEPLIPDRVQVRVLWVPAWVPAKGIYEMLASIGTVSDFEGARERLGDRAVFSLRYTATLSGISPSRVPDRVTLDILGEKVPLLIITKGKPRCCFLCGSVSHTQASCPNPVCRYCNKRGHYVSNCPRKAEQQRRSANEGASTSRENVPTPQQPSTSSTEQRSTPVPVIKPQANVDQVPSTSVATAPAKKVEAKRRHERSADTDEQPAKVVRETVPPTPTGNPEASGVVPETQMEDSGTLNSPESPDAFPDLEIDLDVLDSIPQ